MAKVKVDDYEFEIPDDRTITGKEIVESAAKKTRGPVEGIPYVRRGDTDMVIKDDEALVPGADDRISFIRPFETA